MAVFNYDNGENEHTLMKQINAYVNEFPPSDSSVNDPEKLSSLGKKIYYNLDANWYDYKKEAEKIEFSNNNIAEGEINEESRKKVYKAALEGSYPAVIVVIENGKVIHQEPVSTPAVAPAAFNVLQEKYPKAILNLEDNTGKILYQK